MRKALYILGQLNDADVEWLSRHGERRRLVDGEVIVHESRAIDALFIILQGQLRVTLGGRREVARLNAGEVIGEISFVDSSPPSATVTAVGEAVVLAVPRSLLRDRLASDNAFAARFYRALAIFLTDRLRVTTHRLGYGGAGDLEGNHPLRDELDFEVLDTVALAGDRFSRVLKLLAGQMRCGLSD